MKRNSWCLSFVLILFAGAAGCGDDGDDTESDASSDVVDTTADVQEDTTPDMVVDMTPDTTPDTVLDGDTDDAGDSTDTQIWSFATHQCNGNRTDTMLRDDDGTLYVGCGSTSQTTGIFVSDDDGETWSKPTTTPIGFFDQWRVYDIIRSSDGRLYVAGRDTNSSTRIVSADTSGASWALEEEYNTDALANVKLEVGGFRRDSTGRAIAEDAIGTGIIMRDSDSGDWVNAEQWSDSDTNPQIQDLELIGDRFVGSGATINEPPQIYIEDTSAAEFTMNITELAPRTGIGAFDGEIQGLAVTSDEIVAVGVDQDGDAGIIYVIDVADPATRTFFDLRTLYPEETTWVRGVCRDGDTIVAVGEFSSLAEGLILISLDGGATWTESIPVKNDDPEYTFPPVQQCVVTADTIYVSGADGTFVKRDRPSTL